METHSQLEEEYCPPLDVALFTAIISDFDLSTSQGVADARATLDPLKESAILEEAAGFEPSGVSLDVHNDQSLLSSDGITDDTSISNGIGSLSIEADQDLNGLDDDLKLHLLHDVFGDQIDGKTIKSSLDKHNGDWNVAMEDLLNQVYFLEAEDSDGDKLVAKGIDGFAEDRVSRQTKRKKRRKRISTSADSIHSDASETSITSKWQTSQADIDFIASHIQRPVGEVRTKYNQNGGSVPQTINAFLKEEMQRPAVEDLRVKAQELGQDFPTIAPHYLLALVRITAPSTAAAHELAKALVRRKREDLTIIPQYARISESNPQESSWQDVNQASKMSHISPDNYAAARAQAFAQAGAAHRRSKSNRLYGGAAAYYSQVARDLGGLSAGANSAAMDTLAARQSSTTQLDLHGIDVLNAVRISRERVQDWWLSLGENRVNGATGAATRSLGFSIIVGRGSHSEGGKSKLGPAVSKMLKSEGWKIQDDGAIITVRGKLK